MRKHITDILLLILLIPFLAWSQDEEVRFSPSGGVYSKAFPVTISCQVPHSCIRYTLNGSTPDQSSNLYAGPLTLSEDMRSKSDIYKILISPENEFYLPNSVKKAIVIRAAAFDDNGNRITPVFTQSYFIRALDCDPHGLPVISICADSSALFDYNTGILVAGAHLDPEDPELTGNYMETGRDWEREVNVEYYADGNECFNQMAGLRTHGGSRARRSQQKSLKLYAREEYGKKNFKYKIFEETELKKFKRLVLKAFRSASTPAGMQDWLACQIASNLDMGFTTTRPVVLFLNGEYWGIYFLEEKADERYVESHYGVDHDSVNIIDAWGELEEGSSDNFFSLCYWLHDADLSDPVQYHYFSTKIDIPNIIDYYIFELFSANWDWPVNNVRCWQTSDNGVWHWIFFDGDCCFDNEHFPIYENATYTGPDLWPSAKWSTLFFRKLLESETFKRQFLPRIEQLNRTHFAYQNTKPYLDEICRTLEKEIPQQVHRFNNPHSEAEWRHSCQDIDEFLKRRVDQFWTATQDFFHMEEDQVSSVVCYPNPAPSGADFNLLITAEKESLAWVAVYDLSGRYIRGEYLFLLGGENRIPFDMSGHSGVYIVKVGHVTKKAVIGGR